MSVTRAHIAIVDSNRLFRAGLISLLGQNADNPVGEASSVEELGRQISEGRDYDLILLDAPMSDNAAPCPVSAVRALAPDAHVTVLADRFDPAHLRTCFAAGADGYLLKDISSETLRASLNLILLGEKILPSPLADILSRDNGAPINGSHNGYVAGMALLPFDGAGDLSDREMEILRCLVSGDSNKRIANRLCIAEATVKVHLKSILRKTHAENRTQAAIWALQRGVSGVAASAVIALSTPQLQALIEESQQFAIL